MRVRSLLGTEAGGLVAAALQKKIQHGGVWVAKLPEDEARPAWAIIGLGALQRCRGCTQHPGMNRLSSAKSSSLRCRQEGEAALEEKAEEEWHGAVLQRSIFGLAGSGQKMTAN